METNEIIFEVLQATGLNWTVSRQPLFFNDSFGNPHEVNDKFMNIREGHGNDDNGQPIPDTPLGVVGKQYTILQNKELVETIYKAGAEVFDKDLHVEHPWNNAETLGSYGNLAGGSLRGGSAVFVQLELPSTYIGNSDVKRFITGTNHHNGMKSFGFGSTNQVVCCANTFAIAQKELSKIRHTASMQERIDDAVIAIRKVLKFETKQMEIFEKASRVPFEKKHVRTVMEILFGGAEKLDAQNPSTKLQNQVKAFGEDLNTSVDEQKTETLWTLFNAVTRYTNHSRAASDKGYSLMFGVDSQLNQKTYNYIEELVAV